MKRHALIVAAILAILLPAAILEAATIPSVEMREANYGGGSCGHASWATLLRMHGRIEGAAWWRKNYQGGVSFLALARLADMAGLSVAVTFKQDASFFDKVQWAVIDWRVTKRVRRRLEYFPHAVLFCGFANDGRFAVVIDSNKKVVEVFEKEAFLRHWKRSGGRAISIQR